jgi:hypothetical protein
MKEKTRKICAVSVAVIYCAWAVPAVQGYALGEIVPDVRQLAESSGSLSCTIRAHQLTSAGNAAVRWSTALDANSVKILTQDQTTNGRLNEIETVIKQSLAVWTGPNDTTLTPSSAAQVTRVSTPRACGYDGVNSICFDQADMAFTPGVLAITRVITADRIGIQVGSGAVSSQVGQILDADIYFNPSNWPMAFATPTALAKNPKAYDLESILTHELEHIVGFSYLTAGQLSPSATCYPDSAKLQSPDRLPF